MSLNGLGLGMRGIARQHGRFEVLEPGTDPGVSDRSRSGGVRGTVTEGNLRMGGGDSGRTRVCMEGEGRREGRHP